MYLNNDQEESDKKRKWCTIYEETNENYSLSYNIINIDKEDGYVSENDTYYFDHLHIHVLIIPMYKD